MARDVVRRLPAWLRVWDLVGVRVIDELTDQGDRSRAWLVRTSSGDYVAKLTFDAAEFVEPGLRIAAALGRAGIATGAPVPTVTGALCRRVRRGGWTLAVLEFAVGQPLDWNSPGAPALCGDLLGRVHRTLSSLDGSLKPAGRLLDFYAAEAVRIGGRRGAALAAAVAAVCAFDRREGLTHGLLYGDPAPEVLRDDRSGTLALIDWGTPSWGPLLHDLVSWRHIAATQNPGDPRAAQRLTDFYRAQMTIADTELASLALFVTLHHAIHLTWEPTRNIR